MPEAKFLLLGSQCLAFEGQDIPANVGLLGVVSENEKNFIFSIVDLALNPMLSGSGTNLKMFDYMAAGIPVISTEFGARGIGAINGQHLITSKTEGMPDKIRELLNMDSDSVDRIVEQAHSLTKNKFDWSRIATVLADRINQIVT